MHICLCRASQVVLVVKKVCVLVLQCCPTLCDRMDCSPPGSSLHRISQARIRSGLAFSSPGVFRTQGKEHACNARDPSSVPRSGRSPGIGSDNPLLYSCLENLRQRTEEPGRLQSITLQRARHDWSDLGHMHTCLFHDYIISILLGFSFSNLMMCITETKC